MSDVSDVHSVDKVANVENVADEPETSASSPKEWKPEYPAADAPVTPGYYPEFPVDRILSPAFTFRQDVGDGIQALMAEIHAAGMIIEPLVTRPAKRPGHVEIGPGERRLLAARMLGMKAVPLVVREIGDVEFDRIRLLENLARKDLSDMDLAHVLQYLMRKYPQEYPTQEALGEAFGKTQGWVAQHLAMLSLEKDEIITRVIKPEKLSENKVPFSVSKGREKPSRPIIGSLSKDGKISFGDRTLVQLTLPFGSVSVEGSPDLAREIVDKVLAKQNQGRLLEGKG